ncbi:TetR/AcrR family transcriptional regulator [Sporosarcina koreensis]|uniref:TetR/AcrR family transcriptional regulator n=1 Tax=Sporosarcina koreensis TaxID=334735 RepID=UPI0007575F83|nr:TetR/AcrR family transcriptional regulator [Sporosarcina koreensis]
MRKGEKTRQMIISKSSQLFNQKGYASALISDVMKETGLKKGGIYRHFDSKNELAIEAFKYSAKTMREHYKNAMHDKKSVKEQLLAFIDAFTTLERDVPIQGGCPLMNATIEFDDSTSELIPYVQSAMNDLLLSVEQLMIDGQKNNEISKDINPKQATIIILSSLEGALALSRLYRSPEPLTQTVHYLQSYVEQL